MATREEYIEQLVAKLDEWRSRIDTLEQRAEEAGEEVRDEILSEIETMKRHRGELQERVRKLRIAGDEAWTDLREGTEEAREALSSAFQRARSRFD